MADRPHSGDQLLWLAGGVVTLMGLAWLIVAAPWSSGAPEKLEENAIPSPAPRVPPEIEQSERAPDLPSLADPLRMAWMALEAGMLIEPEELSAWTLFGQIVAREPGNDAARDGMRQVAAALLQRGNVALEQGRFDDVSAIVATVTARIPDHEGALELAAAAERARQPPDPPSVQTTSEPDPDPDPDQEADPVPELHVAFRDALSRNAILRPAGSSAVDVVTDMLAVAPEHELTRAARDLLVTELLDRSVQSIEALDVTAAQAWIDAAEPLAADHTRIELAQERLTRHLIETESKKILPASEMQQLLVTAPDYPRIPLERGIEGWVEVRFLVTPEGTTAAIEVIDASHDRYFREAAVAAVSQWRFEPYIFMDQAIPKSSVARVEFVLD